MFQILTAQVYSIILLTMLLCFNLASYERKTRLNHVFMALVLAAIAFCISLAVQMLLQARSYFLRSAIPAATSVSFILLAALTAIFAAYHRAKLVQIGASQKPLVLSIYALCAVYMLLLAANIFTPVLFSVKNGAVKMTLFGKAAFLLYNAVYILLLASVFAARKKLRVHESLVFAAAAAVLLAENFLGVAGRFEYMSVCPTVMLFVVFITFHIRKNNKIERTNKAIADTLVAIAYIDLASGTFEEISFKKAIREIIGSKGNAQEALDKTIGENLVIGTYHRRMQEFVNLKTVAQRLEGKQVISEEYKGPTNGWSRSSFIPVEYGKNGKLKAVLYTVQWINGEVLSLRGQLDIEETLLECVLTLSKSTDADASINELLANVGTYHNADRAYIFEIDRANGTATNTFEWCKEGVAPQIQLLQSLKLEDIRIFIDLCRTEALNLIGTGYFAEDSVERKLLEQQNIESLMCSPLVKGGEMVGFIGVDNPRLNRETHSILKSVSSFVITELEKKEFLNELYELSYKDKMTGVYNRHANMRDIDEIAKKAAANIGIVYGDVNGLKEMNDKHGHERGDRLIIDAADVLKRHFARAEDKIYRVGGDEFVVICKNIQEDAFNASYGDMLGELGADYILSTGKSWLAQCSDINEHVKAAERGMYLSKQNYHKTHDRRAKD